MKKVRVRLEVEKMPPGTRDPRRISVLHHEELDLDNPQGALEISVPLEEDWSQVVVGYRSIMVTEYFCITLSRRYVSYW